jgi:hypothetical protein
MKDRDVIDAFVVHLRENGHPGLRVDQRPGDENRNSPDIDAIAGTFAIEHTSIDTLPDQRQVSDWFVRAVGSLEQEISSHPKFHLSVTLEYHAVTKRQDWEAIHQALKIWIIEKAPHLVDGRHVLDDVPGIPFCLHVTKSINRRPGLFFARFESHDNSLPDHIRMLFDRKAKKLTKYHAPFAHFFWSSKNFNLLNF